MVVVDFQVEDKANRPRFFQKVFIIADTKFKVILGMFFLKFSNADMSFGKKHLYRGLTPLTRPYLLPNKSRLSIKKTLL